MMRPASTRALHADALFASGWQRRAPVFKGPKSDDTDVHLQPGPVDDRAGRSRVRALLIVRGGHDDDASLATYNAYLQILSGGANEAMT
jgi:hypothetical protein